MGLRSRVPAGLPPVLRRAARPLKSVVGSLAGPVVGSVDAVRTSEPEIVLTFDDGPDPVGTPAVLDALAAHGATATFFVLLTRVRRRPDLVTRVLEAGHEIGLHGVDHRPLTQFPYAEARARTVAAARELEAVTGAGVRWFRPPYGAQTPRSWLATRRAGLVPVLWGPTTWDWRDLPQEDRVRKAQEGARAGAVVLAHDAFAGAADGARDDGSGLVQPDVDRFELVDRVLTAYAERGLRGRSLTDALAHGSTRLVARFRA